MIRKTKESIRSAKWFIVLPLVIFYLGSWLFDPPEAFRAGLHDPILLKAFFYFWAVRQIIRFAWR